MGKRTRKNGKKFIITEIILLLLLGSSIITYIYFENELTKKEKQYNKMTKEYSETKLVLKEKQNELNTVKESIDKYNDIDNQIKNTKKKYFDSIKELENRIKSGKSDKRIAYLTFDDGPYYNTYNVLDILDKYSVKATFFTISANGQYCHDNKNADCFKLYKEYEKRGHTIANHTYTHAIFKGLYSSTNAFMDAIIKQENHIKNQTNGYITNIVRFPGGSTSAGSLKKSIIESLRNRGYGWVDWSAGDGDGGKLTSNEKAWSNFTSTINDDIEVVLFHDYNKITTAILPDAIKYLQDKGYVILPLFYESTVINK